MRHDIDFSPEPVVSRSRRHFAMPVNQWDDNDEDVCQLVRCASPPKVTRRHMRACNKRWQIAANKTNSKTQRSHVVFKSDVKQEVIELDS